jgi:predicted transcriptional regulator
MAKNGVNEAEDVILQALGHSERRGIIRIIGANSDGVTYSSILGETELNTGHLNYHLRNLDGLIEKQDDKLYRLTPLGYKALELVNNLSNEIDVDVIKYVEAAKGVNDGCVGTSLGNAYSNRTPSDASLSMLGDVALLYP